MPNQILHDGKSATLASVQPFPGKRGRTPGNLHTSRVRSRPEC